MESPAKKRKIDHTAGRPNADNADQNELDGAQLVEPSRVVKGGVTIFVRELSDTASPLPLVTAMAPGWGAECYWHSWMPFTNLMFRSPWRDIGRRSSYTFYEGDVATVKLAEDFLRNVVTQLLLECTPLSASVAGICASYSSLAPGWMYQLRDKLSTADPDASCVDIALRRPMPRRLSGDRDTLGKLHVLRGILESPIFVEAL